LFFIQNQYTNRLRIESRRCVFDSLTAERCKHKQYVQHTYDECVTLEKSPIHTSQGIVIRAESIYQLKHISSCMEIILPAEHILKNSSECISRAKQMGAELIAEAPEIMFPGDEEKYPVMLKTLWDIGIKAVSVSNISHIAPTKRLGMKIKGSYGLNITNDIALKEYAALGVSDAVLSFELSSSAIASVRSDMGRGIIAYGRLPVMKTRACPVMGKGGCKSCTQKSISDRMSKRLPILCREHKYSVILSPVPVWLFDKEIKNTDYSVIYFTTESPEEAAHVFELARKRASADFEFTRGSFGRSVL